MTNEGHPGQPSERIDRPRLLLSVVGILLYLALFLFLPAETWAWTRGWRFVVAKGASGLSARARLPL